MGDRAVANLSDLPPNRRMSSKKYGLMEQYAADRDNITKMAENANKSPLFDVDSPGIRAQRERLRANFDPFVETVH
ncbi:hypothetical protein HII31_04213 [Pseudocercospora fuligena]|uniref:Uncharacterized protein n=1 Tax=Pseudocercospora fuligena TaxID=685502 RepID=A0A8H6RP81_9PEZI|nr:hypothetical protein HII31_04213 [Pseudocercospora fuligena]